MSTANPTAPDGVPASAWERLAKREGDQWMIAERNASGEVVGTALRNADGTKGFMPGGKRGLIVAWPLDAYAGTSEVDPIFVCEGASDTAALMGLGLDAVGVPAAGLRRAWLAELLVDRHAVIVADADEPGQTGAAKLVDALLARCPSVRVIEPPEGAKDAREAVIAGATRGDFLGLAERAEPAESATPNRAAINSAPAATKAPEQPATAELIVRLALERFRLGRTEGDEPFAVRRDGPSVAVMLRGGKGALRSVLAREFRTAYGRTASAAALTDAVTTLQGIAQEAEVEPVALRVAEHEDAIVLDLGRSDGRAVMIRPGGWECVDDSPVPFRRTALTAALPEPVRNGQLAHLRRLLNVTDDSWPLLVGYIVAALFPAIPHPIMLLGGLHGTGKTTAAALVAGLFDPCTAENHNVPRDPEAWAMAANGSWGVVVDNVSTIPEWWSDALCKAVTGAGWVRRAHYENYALSVLTFRRVVVLTSIDAGALRGDLGDRLLIVDLEPIPPARRRDERSLRADYAAQRPALLGAVLDLVSAVLRELPTVELASLPRMADFARILAAVDRVLDSEALPLYLTQRDRIAEDVVAADPFGEAVASLARDGEWAGTAGELLAKLTPDGKRPDGWPRTPHGTAGRLKRLIPALAGTGVQVIPPGKADRPRRYIVRRNDGNDGSSEISPGAAADRNPGPTFTGERSTERRPDRRMEIATGDRADAAPRRSDISDVPTRALSAPAADAGNGWGEL